ncbi:MAG: hypothetical protein K2P93_06680 [Alphaproteobacteria bacterium]|nr:hypothetical protein [Alphaproteobacteria bacterium]
MNWKVSNIMNERVKFVVTMLEGENMELVVCTTPKDGITFEPACDFLKQLAF